MWCGRQAWGCMNNMVKFRGNQQLVIKVSVFVIVVVCAAAFVILQRVPSQVQQSQDQPAAATIFAMDTVITLEADGGQNEAALENAEAFITRLENIWSVTKDGSEIYQANHSQGVPVPVSPETEGLITGSLRLAEETGGALNPALYPVIKAWGFTTREYRIPEQSELEQLLENTDYREISLSQQMLTIPLGMEIDFGATAKGYTGDLLVEMLRKFDVTSGIINLGGNVALVGTRPDGNPWRVGIRSPYGEGNMGVLEASDTHIVTSGGYERYFTGEDGSIYWHILNPADGAPARSGIISATIVGKTGIRCDGLSTAVFVMGLDQASEYWRANDDFEMILVTEDNQVYVTEGLTDSFHLNESSQDIPVHIITR